MGILKTIGREARYLKKVTRVLKAVKHLNPASTRLITDEIETWVDKHSSNVALIEDDRQLTFQEMDDYANRVANWGLGLGLKAGDTVAIFARNRLEYVPLWYGFTKIGVIPALLNFQLADKALAHCMNLSSAKILILDHEMADQWETAKETVEHDVEVYAAFGTVDPYPRLENTLHDTVAHRPNRELRNGITAGDECIKMFTSGTTGLPKAAKVTHVRAGNYLLGFGAAANAKSTDRMLMVLPMYHATGGLCGVGAALSKGGAVIVRPKFSASKFWDEAIEHNATMFMYVGELCRFLLSSPPHEKERAHNIRWIIGNGLRPEVWKGFVSRFDIPHVIEFYGATEGNVSLMNLDGPIGSVGRAPAYLRSRFNCDIIRFDVETNTNIRSSDGFCIRTEAEEVGELIGEIRMDSARFRFDGYQNKEATKKKILRDVFKKGDAWFRTGDLMKRDEHDYYYFMDRVGDTYRWKAENVATGEVAAVLSDFPGVTQANVYGVEIKGYDGRAGMASIVTEGDVDLAALKSHVEAALPHYARPVFIRMSQEAETTGTFKFKKINLVKAGFDPANIDDPLYVALSSEESYKEITPDVYADILSGDLRL
ncbi:MAG: long-chain-acyl-CoA synthetase [Maricaulaceae bacterium]